MICEIHCASEILLCNAKCAAARERIYFISLDATASNFAMTAVIISHPQDILLYLLHRTWYDYCNRSKIFLITFFGNYI